MSATQSSGMSYKLMNTDLKSEFDSEFETDDDLDSQRAATAFLCATDFCTYTPGCP